VFVCFSDRDVLDLAFDAFALDAFALDEVADAHFAAQQHDDAGR
jgi:hypothetical protein